MLYDELLVFTHQSGNQLYAHCPFHNGDDTPSFTVNVETREWFCHACSKGGAEKEFLQLYFDLSSNVAAFVFKQWEKKGKLPFPTEDQIAQWARQLRLQTNEVECLHSFGITDETINRFNLGYDDLRIMIPVKSRAGYVVNVRKYLPPHRRMKGAKSTKCINIRNLGSLRYFPYEAFDQDTIYIVEGEKDCLAAISQGYNAVTSTGGSTIPAEEIFLFKGKDVVLMLDTDSVGIRNVRTYLLMLRNIAHSVQVIELPCKDYSEFYQQYGAVDVGQYMKSIEEYESVSAQSEAVDVSLVRSEFTEHLNMWLKLYKMSVVGVEPKIYTVPTKLSVTCRNPTCAKPCVLASENQIVEVDVRQILRFVDSADSAQDGMLKKMYGCKHVSAIPEDYTNIQKIIFQECASFVEGLDESSFENRYGIYMYNDYRLSATLKYNFETCRVTDPSSQQNYYVIRSAESVSQAMPIVADEAFDYFRNMSSECETATQLVGRYYEEWMPALAIEGRPDLFGALMLTYCSVTEIPWQAGIMKGWLDTMIIGDTRTGKSQMAQRLVKILGMGGYINGENARNTGVIGGVQRFGDSWVVTWGAIPMNDRGLLIIDEASGLEIDDIKNLSSTRSSGAVTLNKIVKGEARARTRLVWLSNPRSGKNLSDYYWKGYGAFQEFIPVAEDQARYDMVLSAAREDVEVLDGIDSELQPDPEAWINLFNAAWTIPSSSIDFPKEFKKDIRECSHRLNDSYGGGPLVVGVAVHEKVLRLTCAFAVLCGDIYNGRLKVSTKHLRFAEEFLSSTLEKPSLGYSDYIKEFKRAQNKRSENVDHIRNLIAVHPALKSLLSSSGFKGFQFQEILGIDRMDSSKIMSDLITRGLLRPTAGANYVPDKVLMEIAKQMEA